MPMFTFHEPWCACGKPMALQCTGSAEGYFDDISTSAALFARRRGMEKTPVRVYTTKEGLFSLL